MSNNEVALCALLLGAYAIIVIWDEYQNWKQPRKGLIDMDVEPNMVPKTQITTQLDYLKGKHK